MPGPPPPPPAITQTAAYKNQFGGGTNSNVSSPGETDATTTTTMGGTGAPKISPYSPESLSKATKSNKGGNNSLIAANRGHFASIKLMIMFAFWFLFVIEGILSIYYGDLLKIMVNLWSTNNDCDDHSFFTKDSIEGYSVTELCDLAISQGESWIVIGIIGCVITLAVWLYLLYKIYKLDNKYYVKCNYWFSHVLSMPVFTLIAGISQGLIVSHSAASMAGSLILQSNKDASLYYYEISFEVDDCDAFDDIYGYTVKLLIVSNLALWGFILFTFIIPFMVSVTYCVRGKVVFAKQKEYHCFWYLRPFARYAELPICLYLDTVCCIGESAPERADRSLERYNSRDEKF